MTRYSLREGAIITLRKVPEITLIFWVLKLLSTAMGESTSDYVVFRYNPYLAVIVSGVFLLIALALQLRLKRYIPSAYWFAVTMVAVFGTMAADGLHVRLGVSYIVSSIFFAVVLAIVFIVWRASEKTLSIHSISNLRRELFYWAAVLSTFAFGTAAGDLAATKVVHGYFAASILFLVIMAVPVVLYYIFHVSEVFTFWFAYVMTRPLGASLADWIGKPKEIGGLGFGEGKLALILTLLIVIIVAYISFKRSDAEA